MTELVLSPSTFRCFDRFAREKVGVGVTLFEWGRKAPGSNHSAACGFYSPAGVEYLRDPAAPAEGENIVTRPVIELANSLRLEEIKGHGTRPELNWHVIPEAQLYAYIFFHECSHAKGDVIVADPRNAQPVVHTIVWVRNEIIADRFAWKMLMGEDVPLDRVRGGRDYAKRMLREFDKIDRTLLAKVRPPIEKHGPLPDPSEGWAIRADHERGGPLFHPRAFS